MTRTTIQIPLDSSLRIRAEKAAVEAGFSSVQEIVRVFLSKLAKQTIDVGFYEKTIRLSKKSEARYSAMVNDARHDKETIQADSFNELVSLID